MIIGFKRGGTYWTIYRTRDGINHVTAEAPNPYPPPPESYHPDPAMDDMLRHTDASAWWLADAEFREQFPDLVAHVPWLNSEEAA